MILPVILKRMANEKESSMSSIEELKRGVKPKEVIFRSENLGGPSHSRRTIIESIFSVNYKEEALDFEYGTYDLGIIKLRILSQWIPRNHIWGAGQVARAIFQKDRAWVRTVPYESSSSGITLMVVTYLDEGKEKRIAFRHQKDVDLWKKITGNQIVTVKERSPLATRDLMYEDFLPRVLQRGQLKHMPEAKDKNKTVDDLLDILYQRENADELIKSLRTKVTPTAVINIAKENSHDVLYMIGSLMDIVAKAENAKRQLRELNIELDELKRAWEFMYGGEIPQPKIM